MGVGGEDLVWRQNDSFQLTNIQKVIMSVENEMDRKHTFTRWVIWVIASPELITKNGWQYNYVVETVHIE